MLTLKQALEQQGVGWMLDPEADAANPAALTRAVQVMLQQERERCAKVCEGLGQYNEDDADGWCQQCADEIRRG